MLILFFKAARAEGSDQEPLQDKMRRILRSHVEEAKTEEEMARAKRELANFASTARAINRPVASGFGQTGHRANVAE